MTNENKNTNEVVNSDEDPTVELEVLAVESDGTQRSVTSFETEDTDTHRALILDGQDEGQEPAPTSVENEEALHDAASFEIENTDSYPVLVPDGEDENHSLEPPARRMDGTPQDAGSFEAGMSDAIPVLVPNDQEENKALDRLAAELDRVKADAITLEDEVEDREKILAKLGSELEQAEEALAKRDEKAAERDQQITILKARIETLEGEARQTGIANSQRTPKEKDSKIERELDAARRQIEQQAGQIAASRSENRQLLRQVERSEAYADKLRHEVSDLTTDTQDIRAAQKLLLSKLQSARARVKQLESDLATAREAEAEAAELLAKARANHQREIETLRVELGEVATASARHAAASEKLLSDLMDTDSFRHELERMFNAHEQRSLSRIEEFRKQVAALEATISSHRKDLVSKDDDLRGQLEELVSPDILESAGGESTEVPSLNSSGNADAPDPPSHRLADGGIARALIGNFDNQELRFPLFKDRLTIGRSVDSDIQIDAPYMSRKHAVVCRDGNATRIIDWDSKNGVYVNSVRVTEHFLAHGDIVSIGEAELRYEERAKSDA